MLPQLEVHRLGQGNAKARVLSCGKRPVRQRRKGWRAERRREPLPAGLFLEQLHARQPCPACADEQTAEREQVVVLALIPHSVGSKTVHQVAHQPAGTLNRPLDQVRVLEPDRGGGERGVMPGLAVAQALVEFTDEIGRFFGNRARGGEAHLVQQAGLTQHERAGEVVSKPDRLEVGRGEQVRGSEDVVRIAKGQVAAAILDHLSGRPLRRGLIVGKESGRRRLRDALGEPQMGEPGPAPIVALSGKRPSASRAAVT